MRRGHPKSGEFWPAILLHRVQPAVWLGVALALICSAQRRQRSLDARRLERRAWTPRANLARLAGWDETDRKRWGCKGDRCGDRAAPPFGLRRPPPRPRAGPGYPMDRGRGQLRRETEAGPVAACVLPYALLAEQSYDPEVYATHRIAPRASACVADDPRIATRAPTTNARPVGSMNGATSGAVMDRTNAECGRPGRASLSRTAWGFKSGRASG